MQLPACSQCGQPYPSQSTPYRCVCGGTYDYLDFPEYLESQIDRSRSGLWRYKKLLSFTQEDPVVSLGEGNTPLCKIEVDSRSVWAKSEYMNPTGSYKDRGSATLASFLLSRRVKTAVEDSSGNAGASFAAYAARAGIQAEIYIPESASGPKRKQIEAYGAQVHRIPGPRSEASRAVLAAVENGQVYASHAYMPFGLLGIATIAYEIFEQLGNKAPGTIIAPVGHGGLIYGLMQGFNALKRASVVKEEPFYVGVQALGCAPVFSAFESGLHTLSAPDESDTIAEGVKVSTPVRGEIILRNISEQRGKIIAIDENRLLSAYYGIAQKGFYVEPTSALVWAALPDVIGICPDPVVMILTGTGYKTQI
jgi:threonine synthase